MSRKAKTLRRWRGTAPDDGTLIEAARLDGVWWALYVRRTAQTTNGSWINLKLAADRAPGRANYWLSWAQHTGKLTRVPDAGALSKQLPEVYAWVENVMRDYTQPMEHIVVSDLRTGESNLIERKPQHASFLVAMCGLRQTLWATPIGDAAEASVAPDLAAAAPYICKGMPRESGDGLTATNDDVSDLL